MPRQREANGLREDQCELTEAALRAIVADYTREAGVRQLEREIGRVMRHAAMRVAEGAAATVRIDAADLDAILGPPKFEHEVALRSQRARRGHRAGLDAGGRRHPVHRGDARGRQRPADPDRPAGRRDEGKRAGRADAGEVARAAAAAVAPALFEDIDVHVHVPAGAIPKDGPSAGVAMFIALASLFTDRPVRHDVAMTGEISLRGLVLPVGGIKEKVLAAQRAGLRTVLLPARNLKDLRDVPESARAGMQFVWLETVDDAIRGALA